MSDEIMVRGVKYVRVSGGDASDASWEKGQIQGMGFDTVIKGVWEGFFRYLYSCRPGTCLR